jgi:hypothetical protein
MGDIFFSSVSALRLIALIVSETVFFAGCPGMWQLGDAHFVSFILLPDTGLASSI